MWARRPRLYPGAARRDLEDPGVPMAVRRVSWLYPLLRRLTPKHVTTTENLGRAMLAVAGRGGTGEHILYSPEINHAAAEGR